MKKIVIHLGDAGRGILSCRALEKRDQQGKNWTWVPERVTCKRCLAMYNRRVRENQPKHLRTVVK